ncbi:MAG: DmsE family decaheme c-type cytochrome [Rhodocyclales bacterium]|nr:DmsE family decaheme c-type cytochrome [Rhodocyclales bacterium]
MNIKTPLSLLRTGALAGMMLIGLLFGRSALAVPPEAKYVGEKACVNCHQVENKHFGHTTHAKVFRQNPKNDTEKQVCEACHGPGSLHVPEKDNKNRDYLIGFTKEWGTPIEAQNGQCLNCHNGGQRLHWPGSTHDSNKIACSDCHNPMARFSASGLLKKPSITETCQTCHQQQRAEFQKRSHMPVPEGKMTCEDCHNPHGSVTRPLLKADSVNEVCYACHAEKRGPLLWEHAPVRENCVNCHHPHGSNHDKLLQAARPHLCQQCHSPSVGHPGTFYNASGTAAAALVGGTAGQRVIGRSCQNCHSQIHGSNHPAGARFQR